MKPAPIKQPAFTGIEREPTAPAEPIYIPSGDNISAGDLEKLYNDMLKAFGVTDAKAMLRAAMNKVDRTLGALRLLPMAERPEFLEHVAEEIAAYQKGEPSPEAVELRTKIVAELGKRYAIAGGKKP
jgi:hypothetical protein